MRLSEGMLILEDSVVGHEWRAVPECSRED